MKYLIIVLMLGLISCQQTSNTTYSCICKDSTGYQTSRVDYSNLVTHQQAINYCDSSQSTFTNHNINITCLLH